MNDMKYPAKWIFLFLLFFLILWNCPAKADTDSNELVKIVQPATVLVYVLDTAGKPIVQGSGFFFNYSGHLITNYHVLGKASTAIVKTPDGKEFNVKSVLAEDETDDIVEALVDIPYGSAPYLVAADTTPKVGDPVTVIGSPFGVSKVVSHGSVREIADISKLGKCIVHSAHSFPGSSGSPLVNALGEVVGIETAALVGRPEVNFAIPVERFSGLSPNYRELRSLPTDKTALPVESPWSNAQLEALKRDMRMAESGDAAAQVRLAARYEEGRDVSPDCFEALNLYRKAADQGSLQAQYSVGRMYYSGHCMGQNLIEAARWLKTAAERGLADSQMLYGKMCFEGTGVSRDPVAACMWMMLASSRGNREARNLLRLMSVELPREELNAAMEKAKNWTPAPR